MTFLKSILATLAFTLFSIHLASAQSGNNRQQLDSLMSIDWLDYNYTYLDADLKPAVSAAKFDQWKQEYSFDPSSPLDCADSLSVILNKELNNQAAARIATLRICYSWQRAGWSVLLPADSLQQLSHDAGVRYPYELIESLRNSTANAAVQSIIEDLEIRLKQLELEENLEDKNTKQLMKLAFRYSPDRLKVVDSILASQGSARRQD
jgi:hypothetical protein